MTSPHDITPDAIAEKALADFLATQPTTEQVHSWYNERLDELQKNPTNDMLHVALQLLCQKLEERHVAQ